jgi:hypothetical protein
MHNAEQSSTRKDAAAVARLRALRRAERFDMVVASALLLLLIFGWAIRFAPVESWPRGDFLFAATTRQA